MRDGGDAAPVGVVVDIRQERLKLKVFMSLFSSALYSTMLNIIKMNSQLVRL